MKRYYISHPYTGNEEWNKADAENIRAALKAKYPKKCFINPLGMFGNEDMDYCGALSDAMELLSCCDAIILCAGWEKSTGCRAEKALAMQLELEIEYFNWNEHVPKKAIKDKSDKPLEENSCVEEIPKWEGNGNDEYIDFIRDKLPERERYEQLAEEADELGKAALKFIRASGMSKNLTPLGKQTAFSNLQEEMIDVMMSYYLCMRGLSIEAAAKSPKWKRWAERLGYKNEQEEQQND